jgi:outer membrane protein OmpA-like peptidoglycan-associated protein
MSATISRFTILLGLLINPVFLCPPAWCQDQPQQEFGLAKATKLGMPINTSGGDFAPTISADNKTLIFGSDRKKRYKWKLYIAHRTETSWTEPQPLDNINSNIDSDDWDGGPFLTYDQNYLLLSSDRKGGLGGVDIWMSKRLGEEWTEPKNLGEPINTSGYDGFASMSGDGKSLYFMRNASQKGACNQQDNFDIYCSPREGDGWGEPQKLPALINSEYCESHPIILADSKTLIFSSNRPGGFGGYDLYKTVKRDDGSWSEPVNLGSFINTEKDDDIVSIPASGDIMYFCSGESNEADLYTVPILVAMRPSLAITVAGTVTSAKEQHTPLSALITIIDSETGKDTTVVQTNETDGKYIVILNKGKVYDVAVSAARYTLYQTRFDLKELEVYKEVIRDIMLEPLEIGAEMVLNNIYFEFDSYLLLDESKFELQPVIKLMNDNPGLRVEISAHTDNVGTDAYNLTLSSKRAESVVEFLKAGRIENRRLIAKGYGESSPIASNGTKEGRSQNRRVELKIVK